MTDQPITATQPSAVSVAADLLPLPLHRHHIWLQAAIQRHPLSCQRQLEHLQQLSRLRIFQQPVLGRRAKNSQILLRAEIQYASDHDLGGQARAAWIRRPRRSIEDRAPCDRRHRYLLVQVQCPHHCHAHQQMIAATSSVRDHVLLLVYHPLQHLQQERKQIPAVEIEPFWLVVLSRDHWPSRLDSLCLSLREKRAIHHYRQLYRLAALPSLVLTQCPN